MFVLGSDTSFLYEIGCHETCPFGDNQKAFKKCIRSSLWIPVIPFWNPRPVYMYINALNDQKLLNTVPAHQFSKKVIWPQSGEAPCIICDKYIYIYIEREREREISALPPQGPRTAPGSTAAAVKVSLLSWP